MKRFRCLTILCMASLIYAGGLRPGVDINAGWHWQRFSSHSEVDIHSTFNMGVGTTVPLFPFLGVDADVGIFKTGGGTTDIDLTGRVGFVQMIPTKHVSPYFVEQITLDYISGQGVDYTETGLLFAAGAEFQTKVEGGHPFLEGHFTFATSSIGTVIGIGAGLGLKFSWGAKETDW